MPDQTGPTTDVSTASTWHALPAEAVFARLQADAGGLTSAEARRRL
jgi:hypothetical protein